MKHLFEPEGRAALAALMRERPLLAFDFDGTLAPIVARPAAARIPAAVAQRLRRLAERLPVAVVSGRAVADLRQRLGFEPRFVVGSHGAEDGFDPAASRARMRRLDPLRERLKQHGAAIAAAGVSVEDKGQSLALHYRLAPDRARARALIAELLAGAGPDLEVFGGKMVENAVAAGSPDKAQAVRQLVARLGTGHAFFAGDDVNDEPVFAAAPAHWLTVRIGRGDQASKARYFLDSPAEMAVALQVMLDALGARNAHDG
ncbi:MAG: trehalose-phosphatase [Burkholderiales bacterium]|nr:trehalose-phosphatase [Burkholderiales bacterium]